MEIAKKQIAKFILLPGIVPRVRELALNLHWFAYLMALIFVSTRILPPQHPYASKAQFGKFGVADILFEAGRHLKGGFRHVDQYIVYGSFLLAVLLLVGQFVILLFILATHTADAAWMGMFVTPVRENDIALMMLDKVFEVPNMFGSKFDPAIVGKISIFGKALHDLFAFYNQGMLIVGGVIVIYYLFAVVVETMQTGTPFGQRFQEIYVPIRLCLAILLLLPLGYGFSAGQLLVLKLADWGSGFATNGWIIFNKKAASNPLGGGAMELIVSPKSPQIGDLLRYYSLVHACRAIYQQQYNKTIQPYVITTNASTNTSTAILTSSLSYADALDYFPDTNLKITFGELQDSYTKYPGHIKPYCGTIDVPTIDYTVKGAYYIQEAYWEFLKSLWTDSSLKTYGDIMAKNSQGTKDGLTVTAGAVPGWTDTDHKPDIGYYAQVRSEIQARFDSDMDTAKDQIRADPASALPIDDEVLNFGWGGAGLWFNKIAEYNGAVMSANSSMPVPSSYPAVMSYLISQKQSAEGGMGSITQFTATFGNGAALTDMMSGGSLDDPSVDGQVAKFLGGVYKDMSIDDAYGDGSETHETNNVLANVFNTLFGTEGLFELRGNEQIHPLAKMAALGRSILDRAITYIGGAMIMGGLSGISSVMDNTLRIDSDKGFSAGFAGLAGMFTNFASLGITVGIVLYYVIPFLPFLYFFFAVGRWVKSIFEAAVGIPLWALAHLRIDGEGIPGPAAANGYYLLLEILLRPILIVFGLMAAVGCFSALAIGLDSIFDLVTKNVTGYNPIDTSGAYSYKGVEFKRSDVDAFFYTIMYAVLLYMMAMSCFKLIDLIPNSVLRFIGSGVSEFADQLNLEQDIIYMTGISANTLGKEAIDVGVQASKTAGEGLAYPANLSIETMRRTAQPKGPQAPGPKPASQETQAAKAQNSTPSEGGT